MYLYESFIEAEVIVTYIAEHLINKLVSNLL